MDDSKKLEAFSEALSFHQKAEIDRRVKYRYALNKKIKNLERANAISGVAALVFHLFLISVVVIASLGALVASINM